MKRPAIVSQNMLWEELQYNPMTAVECAAFLGIAKRNANVHIKALRKRPAMNRKRCRISGWQSGTELCRSGQPSPVYAVGIGADIPKPKPISACEASQRHRAKFGALYRIKRKGVVSPWAGLLIKPATKIRDRQNARGGNE